VKKCERSKRTFAAVICFFFKEDKMHFPLEMNSTKLYK